eukprot:Skav225768  [mRNA]  locus=scaffold3092:84523:85158:+ [translate_table: standard]
MESQRNRQLCLCFQREAGLTLLKEAHNLICRGNSCIVIGFCCLSTHLLLCEDKALAELVAHGGLEGLDIFGRNIAEVAEILSSLQDVQHVCLVHHFHPGGVDQSATLWHLGQEILVDGCLGLIGQGHMERHVLMFKEPSHRSHWFRSHLLDLVRRDVGIVCEALHAKALSQLVHRPRHRAEAVEGDLSIHQLKATGAIEVVASTDDHHPEN